MGQSFVTNASLTNAFANVRQGLALSAGTLLAETGTVVFSNSNNVTFGMATSASSYVLTMSASAAAKLALAVGTSNVSNTTASFSNNGALQFGINGQTVTASQPKMNYWHNGVYPGPNSIASQSTTLNVTLIREAFMFPIDATRADFYMYWAGTAAATGSYTISLGLYTFAGSTASLASTASVGVTFSNGTQTNQVSAYGGQSNWRYRSVPLGTWSITPGDYLIGYLVSATGGATASISFGGQTFFRTLLEPGGGDHTPYFAGGIYSAASSVLPSSVHLTAINQTRTGLTNIRPTIRLAGTF